MRKNEVPDVIVATCLESTSSVSSAAGNSRMMLKRRRAGSVVAPRLDDLGFNRGANAGVEIGGGDDQLAIGGLDQGIAEDGKRGACADDVLNNLKTGEQRFPRDDTFHNRRLLRRFGGKKQWFILRLIAVSNLRVSDKPLKTRDRARLFTCE